MRESEDWLEGDGYNAKYGEYIKKFNELDKHFSQVKMRKEEHSIRDTAVDITKKAISTYEEKLEKLL